MQSSSVTPEASTSNAVCYFSFIPSSRPHTSDYASHFSQETPSPGLYSDDLSVRTPSEPSNPLLAARLPPVNLTGAAMDASKVLQLQTAAAYSYQNRPQPQPVQDVLDLSPISSRSGSDTPSASSSRTSVSGDSPTVQFIRCSRCHRTDTAGSKNMIGYGINSYYCVRCADLVGYNHG